MMDGIFGIFHRDGRPAAASDLKPMQSVVCDKAEHVACSIWVGGCAGLGQAIFHTSPEQNKDRLPCQQSASGLYFTAFGRVDNRTELGRSLKIQTSELGQIPDDELLLRAYESWGEACPNRIYGNWAFAAWHSEERRLFLARDHYGYVSIYYYADQNIFAFASSKQVLLALNLAPIKLNEMALAKMLVSWQGHDGENSIHSPIRLLPPAHSISVTPGKLAVHNYWRMEDTPILSLPRREDYVHEFREIFDEAVRCRLRASGPVCVTLSGGLDSSAVAATAAKLLSENGRRLTAFTSVPVFNTESYVEERFGDEYPFAQATARLAGNIDIHPCSSASLSPIKAIRLALQMTNEPLHAAGNMFWILDIFRAAQEMESRTILTGAAGNPGISWTGDIFSQSLGVQLYNLGWRGWVTAQGGKTKNRIIRADPFGIVTALKRNRMEKREWWRKSAIHPDFAHRMRLLDHLLSTPSERPRITPREQRLGIIQPGKLCSGAIMANIGATHGLEFRDPTADARVLAFTLSVPDQVFMDPASGLDRWLIREAMKGRLPDEVRLNRRRGRQSGDLVLRLRSCADEVETALNELATGPSAAYLDVPYMRQIWQMVKTEDTPQAFYKSIIILTRGICAGLFINGFYEKYDH